MRHRAVNDDITRDPARMTRSEKIARIKALAKEMDPQPFFGFIKDLGFSRKKEEDQKIVNINGDYAAHTFAVEKLWENGDKNKVYALCQARLAKDPDDVAGLFLMYEYYYSFVDIDSLLNTGLHLLEVSKRVINKPNFSSVRPLLARSVMHRCEQYSNYSIRNGSQKVDLQKSPFFHSEILLALEADGMFCGSEEEKVKQK